MRKQIKEASGLISRAKDILDKVSGNDRIPDQIRDKANIIIENLESNLDELEKMREH